MWTRSTFRGQRTQAYSCSSRLGQLVWPRVWLPTGWLPKVWLLPKQQNSWNSGDNYLMFQALKRWLLGLLFILGKQSFTFFSPPPFGIGIYKHMKNQCRWIQYSLSCPPNSVLCLYVFCICFFLADISNPHSPTLGCMNPTRLGPNITQLN